MLPIALQCHRKLPYQYSIAAKVWFVRDWNCFIYSYGYCWVFCHASSLHLNSFWIFKLVISIDDYSWLFIFFNIDFAQETQSRNQSVIQDAMICTTRDHRISIRRLDWTKSSVSNLYFLLLAGLVITCSSNPPLLLFMPRFNFLLSILYQLTHFLLVWMILLPQLAYVWQSSIISE